MQSNKTSKKTSKMANDSAATAAESGAAAETTGKTRIFSSKPKKNETNEIMTAKHHRKVSPSVTPEAPNMQSSQPKTTAAAAASGSTSQNAPREPKHEEIANLAHSYWIAGGCANGSAEEHWLRAERELRRKQ